MNFSGIQQISFLTIIFLKVIDCKLFLDITNQSSFFVFGVLKLKIEKLVNILEFNPYLTLQHTNSLCKKLNYDSLHSSCLQCKLDQIFNVSKLVIYENNSSFKL